MEWSASLFQTCIYINHGQSCSENFPIPLSVHSRKKYSKKFLNVNQNIKDRLQSLVRMFKNVN